MYARTTGSRLAGLRLIDPHLRLGRTHAVIPGAATTSQPCRVRCAPTEWVAETYGTCELND